MGSFGITELIVVLIIIVLLFGTTKLKSLGSDLGSAIKGFRKAVGQNDDTSTPTAEEADKVDKSNQDEIKINVKNQDV